MMILCLFKECSVFSIVCIMMILRLSALSSLPLEEVFPPLSHTSPRVNASVLAHLQPKTYPSPFHILSAPPPRDRVSRWTQGWSLTEPWMLFGCHTFPKRLAAAPIVATEGALLRWSFRPPAAALPSDGFVLARECVLHNGWQNYVRPFTKAKLSPSWTLEFRHKAPTWKNIYCGNCQAV